MTELPNGCADERWGFRSPMMMTGVMTLGSRLAADKG
jgi:hypothetical protein